MIAYLALFYSHWLPENIQKIGNGNIYIRFDQDFTDKMYIHFRLGVVHDVTVAVKLLKLP